MVLLCLFFKSSQELHECTQTIQKEVEYKRETALFPSPPTPLHRGNCCQLFSVTLSSTCPCLCRHTCIESYICHTLKKKKNRDRIMQCVCFFDLFFFSQPNNMSWSAFCPSPLTSSLFSDNWVTFHYLNKLQFIGSLPH